jgi:hypothetical protein
MEKEFITYEQALELKELGFDEPCFATFFSVGAWQIDCVEGTLNLKSNTDGEYSILAPLYQQAFRWFREKYDLDKTIDNWTEQPMNGEIWDKAYQYYINGEAYHPYFKTHEEAELECLKKLIEIVKKQKEDESNIIV